MNEIVFQVGQGASHGQWAVMAVDDCELVTTTLDGDAFGFAHGASAGHSTVGGCNYGAHGKVEFSVTSMDFNSGDWNVDVYELRGLEWMLVGSHGQVDFPNIDASDQAGTAATLFDCAGIS